MSLQDKMNVSAKPALKSLKTEVANELGLTNYEQADKGNMTARQNGYVGGYMTKKLVEMAEKQLAGKEKQNWINGKSPCGSRRGFFYEIRCV